MLCHRTVLPSSIITCSMQRSETDRSNNKKPHITHRHKVLKEMLSRHHYSAACSELIILVLWSDMILAGSIECHWKTSPVAADTLLCAMCVHVVDFDFVLARSHFSGSICILYRMFCFAWINGRYNAIYVRFINQTVCVWHWNFHISSSFCSAGAAHAFYLCHCFHIKISAFRVSTWSFSGFAMLITEFSRNFAAHFSRWNEKLWRTANCSPFPIRHSTRCHSKFISFEFIGVWRKFRNCIPINLVVEIAFDAMALKYADELFVGVHIVISALLGQSSIFDVLRQKNEHRSASDTPKNVHTQWTLSWGFEALWHVCSFMKVFSSVKYS